jgi:hypothetical protein
MDSQAPESNSAQSEKPRTNRKAQTLRLVLLCIIGFGVGFAAITVFSTFTGKVDPDLAELEAADRSKMDWAMMRGLNLETGELTADLKRLDGTVVEIPGFMVPLEDDSSSVSEFLLVPSPQACIHVPPPPANQMVHVKMASGRRTDMAFGPIWLVGKLQITDYMGPYGKSSYFVTGIEVRPYQ